MSIANALFPDILLISNVPISRAVVAFVGRAEQCVGGVIGEKSRAQGCEQRFPERFHGDSPSVPRSTTILPPSVLDTCDRGHTRHDGHLPTRCQEKRVWASSQE